MPETRSCLSSRVFFIDNLLVVMIRWTGLAPWEFELPFPGSLTSTFLNRGWKFRNLNLPRGGADPRVQGALDHAQVSPVPCQGRNHSLTHSLTQRLRDCVT